MRKLNCDLSLREKRSFSWQSSKKAFTLAEIMVVLGVIGVLTCILLPTAFQATPDENVMKFKKAHNTLYTVIRELVNSDQYYKDGSLAYKPNGALIDSRVNEKDKTYLCETLADVMNTKKVTCEDEGNSGFGGWVDVSAFEIEYTKDLIQRHCKRVTNKEIGIVLPNNIVIYELKPEFSFGYTREEDTAPVFVGYKKDGFPVLYKVLCVDIDGIHEKSTYSDCVNECPFGYAVRVDGKIIADARVEEWLEKGIQGDD